MEYTGIDLMPQLYWLGPLSAFSLVPGRAKSEYKTPMNKLMNIYQR